LQGGTWPFADFPHHVHLTARYAKDTGINVSSPQAAILFQQDSPAWSKTRYYQDAAIRAAFEKIIQCLQRGEAPRILLSMATGSGKTIIATNLFSPPWRFDPSFPGQVRSWIPSFCRKICRAWLGRAGAGVP
jgi:type I restriction enzyme R subunit